MFLTVVPALPSLRLRGRKKLYSTGLVDSATIDGKILGFPREVNTYLLIYRKHALADAAHEANRLIAEQRGG